MVEMLRDIIYPLNTSDMVKKDIISAKRGWIVRLVGVHSQRLLARLRCSAVS